MTFLSDFQAQFTRAGNGSETEIFQFAESGEASTFTPAVGNVSRHCRRPLPVDPFAILQLSKNPVGITGPEPRAVAVRTPATEKNTRSHR